MWWIILAAAFVAVATDNFALGMAIAIACVIWGDFE
jgi:hypothetical protein